MNSLIELRRLLVNGVMGSLFLMGCLGGDVCAVNYSGFLVAIKGTPEITRGDRKVSSKGSVSLFPKDVIRLAPEVEVSVVRPDEIQKLQGPLTWTEREWIARAGKGSKLQPFGIKTQPTLIAPGGKFLSALPNNPTRRLFYLEPVAPLGATLISNPIFLWNVPEDKNHLFHFELWEVFPEEVKVAELSQVSSGLVLKSRTLREGVVYKWKVESKQDYRVRGEGVFELLPQYTRIHLSEMTQGQRLQWVLNNCMPWGEISNQSDIFALLKNSKSSDALDELALRLRLMAARELHLEREYLNVSAHLSGLNK